MSEEFERYFLKGSFLRFSIATKKLRRFSSITIPLREITRSRNKEVIVSVYDQMVMSALTGKEYLGFIFAFSYGEDWEYYFLKFTNESVRSQKFKDELIESRNVKMYKAGSHWERFNNH